jgi:hypothetical protein
MFFFNAQEDLSVKQLFKKYEGPRNKFCAVTQKLWINVPNAERDHSFLPKNSTMCY